MENDQKYNLFQSGVIPYRMVNGNLEILLITSIRKKKWIIPKGFVEYNLSAFESAKKEAYEEAGIIGSNETIELGEYKLNKNTGITSIKVYSMEVIEELEAYPEMNMRKRKWHTVEKAVEKVDLQNLKDIISKLGKMLQSSR